MADNDQKPLDLDTLTDEEFLKLDPSTLQPFVPPEGESNDTNADANQPDAAADLSGSEDDSQGDGSEQPGGEPAKAAEPEVQPFAPAPNKGDTPAQPAAPKPAEKPAAGAEAKPEDAKPGDKKVEDPVAVQAAALDFYKKVTASFKADGKELQIRSPEDAVRLMQMGVNYSRRMQEMKPLRAQHEMLKSVGLDDPNKLNHMIEVMQGKPDAIQKLLKDRKIDPIDIDTTKEVAYKPANHAVDPKTLAFREAIETTLASEGGAELIKDINSSWDDQSKEALRDQPAIFQNLLEQKKSGVYVRIKKELDYQRTMGFLTDVPFVQAYHQVGDAMQKAGVFGPNLTPKPKQIQVQSNGGPAPIDTGTRKAAQPAPAPNLSSTQQPRAVPSKDGSQPSQPDYWAMSDEDFLKLKPPA
jgi:hypothetical protein